MANKRIIDLTAAGPLAATDLIEIDTGALSLKLTAAQLATFIQTALSLLTLNNAKISLANDGSAYFANGGFSIDPVGGATASAGIIKLTDTGDIEINAQLQGLVLRSRPSNIKYRFIVDDAGQMGTEAA